MSIHINLAEVMLGLKIKHFFEQEKLNFNI